MPIEIGSFSIGSVVGSIVGGIAGNFFAIGLAWRKDFNEMADEIFTKLSDEHRYIGNFKGVTEIEFKLFRRRMLPWNRRKFDRCVKAYYEAKREKHRKEDQGFHHQGTPEIRAAIEKLLRFTNRK
jgi:hypothetical protein